MTVTELLIPSDDEVALVTGLSARMDVHVGTRIPNPRPEEFIRVVSAGGAERDLVSDSFTLTVEGFAATEGRARFLCASAIAHAQAAGREGRLGGVVCYGVGVASLPANLPMPSVPDRFRYSATITAALRKVAA